MDLFHAITQGIENVLSCHWASEIKSWKPNSTTNTPTGSAPLSRNNSSTSIGENIEQTNMSQKKMMNTETGGEQTQYEGQKVFTREPDKSSGHLGTLSSKTEDVGGVSEERATKTTENIRYGQNISESGMGGMTTTSAGTANQEGGYGGTEAQEELEKTESNPRTQQGYSAKTGTHDHKVGA